MGKFKYLFWIDLETTGTDEKYDPILEAAWIITEKTAPFDEVSHGSLVINPSLNGDDTVGPATAENWFYRMGDYVKGMHMANGLLADIDAGRGVSIGDTQDAIISQLSLVGGKHDFLIAGSGVAHFDRRMIMAQMPRVDAWLQYPCMDVGVIRRALEMLDGSSTLINDTYGANIAATGGTQHRAQDDIRDHLNEWRVYAQCLQGMLDALEA